MACVSLLVMNSISVISRVGGDASHELIGWLRLWIDSPEGIAGLGRSLWLPSYLCAEQVASVGACQGSGRLCCSPRWPQRLTRVSCWLLHSLVSLMFQCSVSDRLLFCCLRWFVVLFVLLHSLHVFLCHYYTLQTDTHTYPFNSPLSGTTWILLKQETVSGSGISWAIWKSAPRSRQITTPAPHHSVFYRADAFPASQPTASKHWRQFQIQY